MKLSIQVKSKGPIILTDKDYIAAGGEAAVYKKGNTAYKIYHDPSKMISDGKIKELQVITSPTVLKPQDIILHNNKTIGYIMSFVTNTHPICKLFTKTFRDKNNLEPKDIVDVVKKIQETIQKIHRDGCLIVDLNELNLLASKDFKDVYFIDVDSYQTKSYPATAIMESIRDRQVKGNQFTTSSDWFSFAVIASQLYLGIHPYKGRHPNYKPGDWSQRMDDGISIFDSKVTLPRTCYDFSVIPKAHYDWFQDIFVKNMRSIPPLPDESLILIPISQFKVIESTGDFDVSEKWEYPDPVLMAYNYGGADFIVTTKKIYDDQKEYKKIPLEKGKVGFCNSGDEFFPATCYLRDDNLAFFAPDKTVPVLGGVKSQDFMMRNDHIYSLWDEKIIEYSIMKTSTKFILSSKQVCNASDTTTKFFDGVIFQDLLGKQFITLPFEPGKCIFKLIKELDGYRVLEAKSERNIVIALTEKGGSYHRFIFTFNDSYSDYKLRIEDDVSYCAVNFTVKPNGVCILATDTEVQIFKDDKIKKITNAPFDATNKLMNRRGDVFFIDGNKIFSIKAK